MESLLTSSTAEDIPEYSLEELLDNEPPPPPTNTPTPPSPKLPTLSQCTMQLENIPKFSGTQEDNTQPLNLLKSVKCMFLTSGTTTDKQRISLFELYLKSDSSAEDWFNDVRTPKKTWLDLEREFRARFPNIKKATKTAPELERELGVMRIMMEELGKTEKFRGEDIYTHTIFAEKILNLAKQVKIKTTTSGLWNVRDELPEVLREKVPENQASWIAFAQAIKDVEMGHIQEGIRKHRKKMANNAKIKADISFLKQCAAAGTTGNVSSPTEAIRAQLANTTITQQPINHMPQGDMFSGSSGRGGNLFPKPACPLATEAEKATLKANLELYPIQPATPKGEAAYLDQLRAWC